MTRALPLKKKNGNYGLLDTNGNKILWARYEEISDFNQHGIAVTRRNDLKYGLVNNKGDIVTWCRFDEINTFNKQGIATFEKIMTADTLTHRVR